MVRVKKKMRKWENGNVNRKIKLKSPQGLCVNVIMGQRCYLFVSLRIMDIFLKYRPYILMKRKEKKTLGAISRTDAVVWC